MAPKFYFQFSEGSYSDYQTHGLYECDHEISKEEWDEHYETYLKHCATFPTFEGSKRIVVDGNPSAVSYTHLTLPTIYSV